MRTLRVVGPGRAGLSLCRALARVGWNVLPPLGRTDDLRMAAVGADLLLLCVPDAAVASVAAAVAPVATTVVAHVTGSLGLDTLAAHPRRASVHPLVALPNADLGAERLLAGAWFAVAGDSIASEVVDALGGRSFAVDDGDRAAYHAAACIAANHVVALMGQVERVAAGLGIPVDAYLALARASLDNVAAIGPAAALTGPVARQDWDTVAAHVAALDASERASYLAMALSAARLAGLPENLPIVEIDFEDVEAW